MGDVTGLDEGLTDPYAKQEADLKSGKTKIKKAMKRVIGWDKAEFDLKTLGIIKMYLCCRIMKSRQSLRYASPSAR